MSIAEEHCRLGRNEQSGRALLINLAEASQTLINGHPVNETCLTLQDGDVITIVERCFRYEFTPEMRARQSLYRQQVQANAASPGASATIVLETPRKFSGLGANVFSVSELKSSPVAYNNGSTPQTPVNAAFASVNDGNASSTSKSMTPLSKVATAQAANKFDHTPTKLAPSPLGSTVVDGEITASPRLSPKVTRLDVSPVKFEITGIPVLKDNPLTETEFEPLEVSAELRVDADIISEITQNTEAAAVVSAVLIEEAELVVAEATLGISSSIENVQEFVVEQMSAIVEDAQETITAQVEKPEHVEAATEPVQDGSAHELIEEAECATESVSELVNEAEAAQEQVQTECPEVAVAEQVESTKVTPEQAETVCEKADSQSSCVESANKDHVDTEVEQVVSMNVADESCCEMSTTTSMDVNIPTSETNENDPVLIETEAPPLDEPVPDVTSVCEDFPDAGDLPMGLTTEATPSETAIGVEQAPVSKSEPALVTESITIGIKVEDADQPIDAFVKVASTQTEHADIMETVEVVELSEVEAISAVQESAEIQVENLMVNTVVEEALPIPLAEATEEQVTVNESMKELPAGIPENPIVEQDEFPDGVADQMEMVIEIPVEEVTAPEAEEVKGIESHSVTPTKRAGSPPSTPTSTGRAHVTPVVSTLPVRRTDHKQDDEFAELAGDLERRQTRSASKPSALPVLSRTARSRAASTSASSAANRAGSPSLKRLRTQANAGEPEEEAHEIASENFSDENTRPNVRSSKRSKSIDSTTSNASQNTPIRRSLRSRVIEK